MPVSSPATERSRRTTDTGIASREMLCRFNSVFRLRKWHIDGTWPLVGSLTISLGWVVTAWLDLHYHTEHTEVTYNSQHIYIYVYLSLSLSLSPPPLYSKHLQTIFTNNVLKMFQHFSQFTFATISTSYSIMDYHFYVYIGDSPEREHFTCLQRETRYLH